MSRSIQIGAITLCLGMLAIFATVAQSAAAGKSATFDEPAALFSAWAQVHFLDFSCNPEDPPLCKYYIAARTGRTDLPMDRQSTPWNRMPESLSAASVLYPDEALYQTPGVDADAFLRAARQRMVLLGVALGGAIAWWAWRLRGPLAAIVATAAFCFDPNFLAHAPIVKNDVLITLVFLLLMGAIWLLGQRASLLRCAAVVLLVAIALTTKFSGLLAFPILAIALVFRSLMDRPWLLLGWSLANRRLRLAASLALLAAAILFGYFFIWACYGFRFDPSSDPKVTFNIKQPILYVAESEMRLRQDPVPLTVSEAQLAQWARQWKPDAAVGIGKALNQHHLLPQAWIFGFLYTYGSSLARPAFLCGQIRAQGWWYYFPLAMLFKTPLMTLAGLALAAALGIAWARRRTETPDCWTACAASLLPICYMAVSMHGNLNIGLRHIFPVYPFLFIFLGVMAAQAFHRKPKTTGCVLVVLLAGLIAETAWAYPDYIPFFNVAAGGSRGGLRLLSDSNLDWGQDLPLLADWQRRHLDRPVFLSYFGAADPSHYGIVYYRISVESQYPDAMPSTAKKPILAISATMLQGTYLSVERQKVMQQLRRRRPLAVLGGSIYLFNLP